MRILSLFAITGLIYAAPHAGVNPVRLRWVDPAGRQPITYKEWAAQSSTLDARAGISMVLTSGFVNVVEVLVNSEIYGDLTPELTQYTTDLQAQGYSVRIDTTRTSSPQAIRTLLQGIANLNGVVMVGELPVAWYESDWGGGAPEEFPCDLYFADLDGTFVDADGDGLYDDHTGNVAPEIWVGRLYARPLTWDDEVRLLKHYFYKDHLYRTGGLTLPDRGLCFNDEDWSGNGNCGLTAVYPTVTVIEDATTTASNYRTQLLNGYEWIHVMSHSSPWGHTFKNSDDATYNGTVFNCEDYAIQPHCNFYDLFCCSGARYVEENYQAGWDIFNEDWGLAAVGSTKTGSMIGYFDAFYTPMSTGSCIGDAFKSWFVSYGESDRDWHYGLCIIGDPTLKPRHGTLGSVAGSATRPEFPTSAASYQAPTLHPSPLAADPAEVVGADPQTDANPAIACAPDGKVWVAWVTGRSTTNGRFDIYGAYRSGSSWSSAMPIGYSEYWEQDPALGIDNTGRPVCVWSRFEDTYHYDLYYSVWNGSSWSAAALISDDPSEDMHASMTRDSTGKLWCLWQTRRDYWADIYACYWNGSTWSTPQNVTRDTAADWQPSAITDRHGRPWVLYSRYNLGKSEVWSAYYIPGAGWTKVGPISSGQHRTSSPSATRDRDGHIRVAWQAYDSLSADIYTSCWNDTAWSTPAMVSTSSALDVQPAMACDSAGKPWIVWQSKQSGNWNIYGSYCDGGLWTEPAIMDSNAGFNLNPRIACTPSGVIWATWQNYTAGGNWEIEADDVPLSGAAEVLPTEGPRTPLLSSSSNPAGRAAVIHFASRTGEVGRLEIYDRLGRLTSDLGEVSGTGTITLGDRRPAVLTPGVYFVRLRTASGNAEIKLVLTR